MNGLIIAFIALFGPCIFIPKLWFDFRVYALFLLLCGIILTHPKMSFEKLGSDAKSHHDKKSLLWINIGFYLSILPMYIYYCINLDALKPISYGEAVALILAIFAVLFRWYSIKVLGQWFTSEIVIQNKHQLIQTGPYQYLRHPGYTGSLLFGLSLPFIFSLPVFFVWSCIVLIPVYLYRIFHEEQALKEKFPDQYPRYSSKTKRLVPFIY